MYWMKSWSHQNWSGSNLYHLIIVNRKKLLHIACNPLEYNKIGKLNTELKYNEEVNLMESYDVTSKRFSPMSNL